MPDYNFKNNLKSTLQSKLWNDATSIYCNHVVESEDADTRRNAWPAFPFTLTIVDTANDHIEIIKCTSLANNSSDAIVFHCDRAQESTTAQTFEIATTNVEHRLTAEALNTITSNIVVLQPSMTGSATLNGATDNTVQLTDIVTTLGLEVGDVIRIQYSGYNKLHTVESITNNNLIVVNYEHAGNRSNGILKLENTTATVTVTRIAKWYNAPLGLGQAWVDVTASRAVGTTYTNSTGRPIQILVQYEDSGAIAGATFKVGSLTRTSYDLATTNPFWFSAVIPNGDTYSISGGVNLPAGWELR